MFGGLMWFDMQYAYSRELEKLLKLIISYSAILTNIEKNKIALIEAI